MHPIDAQIEMKEQIALVKIYFQSVIIDHITKQREKPQVCTTSQRNKLRIFMLVKLELRSQPTPKCYYRKSHLRSYRPDAPAGKHFTLFTG